MRIAKIAELALWTLGVACLSVVVYSSIVSARAQTHALSVVSSWKDVKQDATEGVSENDLGTLTGSPDQSLWSAQRVEAHTEALKSAKHLTPVGAITIAALDIQVAVFDGTSEKILNLGAGRVIGTAPIGADGNIAIAAHRDGYFRSLKDISIGQEIVVDHPLGEDRYTVTNIQIVEPDDVSVLEQNGASELTLITCYPFYFVGDAPQRFIVQAERNERSFNFSNQ